MAARAAERARADGLWVTETGHDPFVSAALMLAATRRLEVGTSVAIAFARSPVVLALAAFDLAALSGGRFELGLGTQVRGHVERRFGMAWSAPAPRLEEWVGAIDACFATWQHDAPFRYRSEHLDLALMPPFFRPPPLPLPTGYRGRPVRISLAGVGPALARLAGRVGDGFHVHPLHTERYLAEVLEPALAEGEAERLDSLANARAERIVPVFVVDEDDAGGVEEVRRQIAFYASTPTYRRVLDLHGRAGVGERLGRLAVTGRWDEMPALVDDELLRLVAVVGRLAELGPALRARVAGHADRVVPLLAGAGRGATAPASDPRWARLATSLRAAAL